jgi:diguanylate cyclase (GGDEF)-like protein/PAS domain S-box-containing protein
VSDGAGRPSWAGAALDETLDPVIVAHPEHRDGQLVDFVVDYANPAALTWGTDLGAVLDPGTSLSRAPRFPTYVEVFTTGSPVLLSAVPSGEGPAPGRFVDLRVTRVSDRLMVAWRDVSERVAAERGMAEAEARFAAVLENHPDPSMLAQPVTDDDGVVTDLRVWFLNRAARDWGATPGARLGERLAGRGQRDLFDAYLEVARTGRPMARDGVPITSGGEDRLIDVRAAAVDGAIVATWRDVTDRRRIEQAVQESEQRFRLAFDDAPVGMAITDVTAEGSARYVQVNRAFAAMLGLTPGQMIGRSGADFTHPDHRELDASRLARPSGRLVARQVEKRMVRADGSTLWVKESAAPAALDGHPTYVISHLEDITERRAAEAELERRALYDPLTGLANRVLLLDHLEVAARELRRSGGQVAVLYLDLDHFKDVNDTLGHAAGDEVLREVADRVVGVLRPDATAARLAGDEFVVATRVQDDLTAVRIAERLHAAIVRPIRAGAREIVARPSIGVATSDDPDLHPDDLLRRADVAMYHAKQRGTEPWALYDDDLHALAVSRLAVEEDLRTALARSWFRLHYQPVVDLTDGRVVAAEALLRLDHPERGLLRPAEFLDVAEDCQLVVPIGGWVLGEATRQLAQWQQVRPDMVVSVNISPRQVRHLVVRDQVRAALRDAGTDPHDLLLEITEPVLLDADAATLAELRDVTSEGCGLAIDDFGTGCSSLANLTRFPVTEVKIDRTFVAGLGVRERDTAVVAAIIGLAETLGLGTVAEGVETAEQLAVLRELGCRRAQGFHLGRPMTGDELGALLG